jgi:FkbM family methyltransferase
VNGDDERLPKRVYASLKRRYGVLRGRDLLCRAQIESEFITVGNARACWRVVPELLSESSVVYSIGVGTDISFDLELIEKFGLCVQAFDPTPRSIEWIRSQTLPDKFVFHPYGVASLDGACQFNPPKDPRHISHTLVARKVSRPSIQLPVRRLQTILTTLGHREIDLLKMDVEGAEYAVIDDMLGSGVAVNQLLVEFHHRWPEIGAEKTKEAIRRLNQGGFSIFNVSPSGEEYGFVRTSRAIAPAQQPSCAIVERR